MTEDLHFIFYELRQTLIICKYVPICCLYIFVDILRVDCCFYFNTRVNNVSNLRDYDLAQHYVVFL